MLLFFLVYSQCLCVRSNCTFLVSRFELSHRSKFTFYCKRFSHHFCNCYICTFVLLRPCEILKSLKSLKPRGVAYFRLPRKCVWPCVRSHPSNYSLVNIFCCFLFLPPRLFADGYGRDPCFFQPCLFNGRCVTGETLGEYRCECPLRYDGPHCEVDTGEYLRLG